MVFVEISDETLRDSFAGFLDARFGGSVYDRDGGVELDYQIATMPPDVQLRLTERLLWAWSVGQTITDEITITMTASTNHEAAQIETRQWRPTV